MTGSRLLAGTSMLTMPIRTAFGPAAAQEPIRPAPDGEPPVRTVVAIRLLPGPRPADRSIYRLAG